MGTVDKGKDAGERVIAPTRRPDGSLRKEIRIRAGYTPQDEVAIYQSKAALSRKGTDVPPGYDPESAVKPKSKAAKKNEKRKEKKQASRATSSTTDSSGGDVEAVDASQGFIASNDANILAEQLGSLKVVSPAPLELQQEEVKSEDTSVTVDLEKRIRAIKKKIRLAEAKQQASVSSAGAQSVEQVERLAKLQTWQQEVQDLEALLASVPL